MSEELKPIDPKDFTIVDDNVGVASIRFRAGWKYKGELAGVVIGQVLIQPTRDFDNITYQNAKDVFVHCLTNHMLSKDYVATCSPLQFNAEPFQKAFGVTYDEALDAGDLTVDIVDFSMESHNAALVMKKKENG